MTEVRTAEEREQVHEKESESRDGMQGLSVREEQHYIAPLPESDLPPIQPFPARVMAGLGIGALLGSLLGAGFGLLLQRNILIIPGWEGLYSMGPFTFVFFWAVMGLALGVITIGIGVLLTAALEDQPEPKKKEEEEFSMHERH